MSMLQEVFLVVTGGTSYFGAVPSFLSLQPVSLADREVISRLRNCVVSLVTQRMMLYDTSILYCYEASLPHQVPPPFLLLSRGFL